MSQASKSRKIAGRARKEAREEKQAKNIINILFGALIVCAVAFAIYYCTM